WDSTPISGPRLMHEIKQALPDNALVFSEGVTNTKHVEMAIAPQTPVQLVKVRGGGIGPGLPGALGAALARPDRKVVGIASDGAGGGPARRVETTEELAPALREAICHRDGPFLLDVVLESPVPGH